MSAQPSPTDCLGCTSIEAVAIRYQGRYLCPTCPELPPEKRRQATPADAARAGLGDLLRRSKE